MRDDGNALCIGCAHLRPVGSGEATHYIGRCGWAGPLPAWATKADAEVTARWIWNGAGLRITECPTFDPKVPT